MSNKGGYVEEYGSVYGCYVCAEIMGEYTVTDDGWHVCGVCKEPTIISFTTAIDFMLKLQREGHTIQSEYYDEEGESELDIDPELEELEFNEDE